MKNKQILLDSRPQGDASADNFKLVSSETPELKEGQILIHHQYLSLDPYMRMRMTDAESYAPPQELGTVMVGGTVGDVVESKNPEYKIGDSVSSFGGWQEYSVVDPAAAQGTVQKIDVSGIPINYYLGVVGMPGITAWIGLFKICQPKPGETVLVSSAAGAVGSVVGQLAKAHGCRTIGIAGGDEKCRYVVEELGFDACVNYKKHSNMESLAKALREHAPKGIDCNFENVGGMTLDAALACMNNFGRIALCGLISGYEGNAQPLTQVSMLLSKRLMIKGFINWDYKDDIPDAEAELGKLVKERALKYRETIAEGLESAPEAFLGMLKGKNLGKQLVKIASKQ